MIYDHVDNFDRYAAIAPEVWEKVKKFIAGCDENTAKGRHKIDGDMVMADVNVYETAPEEAGRMENHRRYADIQLMLSGREHIVVAPVAGMAELEDLYAVKDCGFYRFEPKRSMVRLPMSGGSFAIFYPGEAHMPGRGDECCAVRKIVFKVDATLLTR